MRLTPTRLRLAARRGRRPGADRGDVIVNWVVVAGLGVLLAIAVFAAVNTGLLGAVQTILSNISDAVS